MTERKCCACGEIKQLTDFIRHRSKPSGYEYCCKVCNRVRDKKRRADKKQFIKKHPKLFKFGFLGIKTRSQSVAQYSKDGVFIARFSSAKEAGDKTNIQTTQIHRAASTRRLTAGGFRWKYILSEDFGTKNSLCQCCGKLVEDDLLVNISLECLRKLKNA